MNESMTEPTSKTPAGRELASTKTYPPLVRSLSLNMWLRGGVTHHEPSDANKIGQSGLHTFVDDIISVVLSSANESDAWKRMHEYLEKGEVRL